MAENKLSLLQSTILFVVEQNAPVSVADVAGHALIDVGSARSRLATLERHNLIARTYTGHYRSSTFAYELTEGGAEALASSDVPTEEGGCVLCDGTFAEHRRFCVLHPDRVARRMAERAAKREDAGL